MNQQVKNDKTLTSIKYPLIFDSQTSSKSGINSSWDTHSKLFKSTCCVPVEFNGPGGALSPEDIFNHALTSCFVATFKVLTQNSKLTFDQINIASRLIAERNETQNVVMKSIFIDVKIYNPSNTEKALLLAKKASESGFILNSVKTERHFSFEVIGTNENGT